MVSCKGLWNAGVEHVMMDIVRNLSDKFHFDMLLFTKEVCFFEPEFLKYGTVFRIPNYEGTSSFRNRMDFYIRFFRIYKGVKKILKENGPYDVIHCHNYFEAAPCLTAAYHCGVPVRVSHSHNKIPRNHFILEFYNIVYRFLINRYATNKAGCSREAADYLFGKNKGISVPNAIDLNKFNVSNYPKQKIKHSFIHVGRFGEQKNQLFLLDIFKEIQKKWTDATLKLVGGENDENKALLQQKTEKLRLNNVYFLAHDSDVPALLAQSEYMIFPSKFEGFGLALAEAQAMKVKCFASDVIPKDSDIGLCKYISLNKSAQYWANEIFKAEKEPVKNPDTYRIDLISYADKIKSIYEGKR